MAGNRTLMLGWVAAVLAIGAFCALGSWQLRRMHQKEAMLARLQQVEQARVPVPLAAAQDPARAHDYDWAAGSGHFAAAAPVRLDNQSRQERAGMRAFRLFVPEQGPPLLVELGWQPLGRERAHQPQIAAIQGTQRIAGLLMPPPSRGLVAAVTETAADGSIITTGLDAPELAGLLKQPRLPPRVLRLDPALALGYVRDMDILPNTLPPERHLGYAVQWFGLAATVLVTALLLTFRRSRSTVNQ